MRCDLACTGCYENAMRAAGNEGGDYDLEAMKTALLAAGVGKPDGKGGVTGFSGFGGEFLLTPIRDIERLLDWATSIGAPMGIQTNGAGMTDRHFALFKKHRVSVGMSLDGPDELNDWRQAKVPCGTSPEDHLRITRTKTEKSNENLKRCLREGISTSLIVTISTFNAGSDERLTRLIKWLLSLRDRGLRYVNLHLLETHNAAEEAHLLTQERQIEVFRRLRKELVGFDHVSPFADMKAKLTGGAAHCTFNFCSPSSTPAVTGIDGQGNRTRCGRLNNDGVAWERSTEHGYERYLSLYLLPMSQGGCGGCRFYLPCGGGNCPGEAKDSDWRNKTRHCATLTALFEDIEQDVFMEGKEPISMSLRRPGEEAQMIARWTGQPVGVSTPHGDQAHQDRPHGDEHQDHTDTHPHCPKDPPSIAHHDHSGPCRFSGGKVA